LSVDRGDYTQGVTSRLDAINRFFERYPKWKQRLVFLQVCQRADPSAVGQDDYLNHCKEISASINGLWSKDDWRPIAWSDTMVPNSDLALLYRKAAVLLANPIRDGLCLEAKEYIACQSQNPGVLTLSPGAACWHQLGDCAILTDPEEPD